MQARSKLLNRQTGLIVIAVVLVFGVSAYVGRGWIRESGVAFFVRTTFMPKVQRSFNSYMPEVNELLSPFGLKFDTTATDVSYCAVSYYQGIHETAGCLKGKTSNKVRPSAALTAHWRASAQKLESQLLASGWTNDTTWQPIETLLDIRDPAHDGQQTVGYSRKNGAVVCDITIRNSPASKEVYATESCTREVKFFGGY